MKQLLCSNLGISRLFLYISNVQLFPQVLDNLRLIEPSTYLDWFFHLASLLSLLSILRSWFTQFYLVTLGSTKNQYKRLTAERLTSAGDAAAADHGAGRADGLRAVAAGRRRRLSGRRLDPAVHGRWLHLHRLRVGAARAAREPKVVAVAQGDGRPLPRRLHDGPYSPVWMMMLSIRFACFFCRHACASFGLARRTQETDSTVAACCFRCTGILDLMTTDLQLETGVSYFK